VESDFWSRVYANLDFSAFESGVSVELNPNNGTLYTSIPSAGDTEVIDSITYTAEIAVNSSVEDLFAEIDTSDNDKGRYNSVWGVDDATLTNLDLSSDELTITSGEIKGSSTQTIAPSNIRNWGNLKVDVSDLDANNNADVYIYSDNLIPTMTSNTAPSGVVSASSVNSNAPTAFDAYKAFDGSTTTNWYADSNADEWLKYQFTTATQINFYSIYFSSSSTTIAPKDWTFEGSNDDTNWTTLDTVTNETSWSGETRYFVFSNSTNYTYYRINISANNGDATFVGLGELKMYTAHTSSTLSNDENMLDLSSINATTYPSINISYTLSRDTTGDTSPTVYNHSVTWKGEGSKSGLTLIDETTLTATAASYSVNISSSTYSEIILCISDLKSTTTVESAYIRFNNNTTGGNYYYRESTYGDSNNSTTSGYILLDNAISGSAETANRVYVRVDLIANTLNFIVVNRRGTETIFSGVGCFNGGTITSIQFVPASGSIASGTKFKILGVNAP
jgi:hypothetical protein